MIFVNGIEIERTTFPDGTPLIKVERPFFDSPVQITWKYDDDAEFMILAYITNHLREKGIKDIELHMPYIPNARFDRVKNEEEVFTLKYFAKMLNSLEFNNVCVLDPHSYVSEALIDHLEIQSPSPYIGKALSFIPDHDNLILYFPDEGAMKRYSELAEKYHLNFAFGIKERDWETGEIRGIKVEGAGNIAGKNVLIIDDICSRGGTFYHSAKALKEKGVNKIYLYVSHCENTILDGDLIRSNLIEQIFTTDSIYHSKHDRIRVL